MATLSAVEADLRSLATAATGREGLAGQLTGLFTGAGPEHAAVRAACDKAVAAIGEAKAAAPGDEAAALGAAVEVSLCGGAQRQGARARGARSRGERKKKRCPARARNSHLFSKHSQAALDALLAGATSGTPKLAAPALAGLASLAASAPSIPAARAGDAIAAVATAAGCPTPASTAAPARLASTPCSPAEEAVRLRAMQAALALASQAPAIADAPGGAAALLGVCLRALALADRGGHGGGAQPAPSNNNHSSASLAGTAAATARQVVALAFERAAGAVGGPGSPPRLAAAALLSDLCSLADPRGAGARPPAWASGGGGAAASLPPATALELIDVALSAPGAPGLFGSDPAFGDALRSSVRLALLARLQAVLEGERCPRGAPGDAAAATPSNPPTPCLASGPEGRAALRATRTALARLHTVLGPRAAPLVGALVAGASAGCPPAQRAATVRALRDLCGDTDLLLFLFGEFDARAAGGGAGAPPRAAEAVVRAAADAASSAGAYGPAGPAALASLVRARERGDTAWADGGGASLDGAVPAPPPARGAGGGLTGPSAAATAAAAAAADATTCAARAAALGFDGVLRFIDALEEAAAGVAGGSGDAALSLSTTTTAATTRRALAAGLLAATWRPAAGALADVLTLPPAPAGGETVAVRALAGLQRLARAAALLGAAGPRDALLSELARLALPSGGMPLPPAAPATQPATAPSLAARLSGGGLERLLSTGAKPQPGSGGVNHPAQQQQHTALSSTNDDALALGPAHVHAFRCLFSAAHTLGEGLGPAGWAPVLGAVTRLDAALACPRTTAGGGNAPSPARDSLAALRAAADGLFTGAATMSDAGVGALVAGLAAVHGAGLPAAAAAPGGAEHEGGGSGVLNDEAAAAAAAARLPALARMADVVVAGSQAVPGRAAALWPALASGAAAAAASPSPAVRAAGLEILGRAVAASLAAAGTGGATTPRLAPGVHQGEVEAAALTALAAVHDGTAAAGAATTEESLLPPLPPSPLLPPRPPCRWACSPSWSTLSPATGTASPRTGGRPP